MAVSWESAAPVVMAFLLFLSTILSTGSCHDQVPLVLWSSKGYPLPQQSLPPVGHLVTSTQLDSYLGSVLPAAPKNTLLFLQDELSVDDFTVFGGVFGNKQDSAFPHLEAALQESSPPLVLPALSWGGASALLPLLQQHLATPPVDLDLTNLAQLHLNASVAALLVIHLPYKASSGPTSTRDVLSGNDGVIGQVLDIMKAQAVPYIAIYTGRKPSRVALDTSDGMQSIGRALLETTTNVTAPLEYLNENGTVCILMWAESLWVNVGNFTGDLWSQTFGPNATVTLANSFCNVTNNTESLTRLVLDYGNVPRNLTRSLSISFSMRQNFYPVSARDWFTLDTVELEYGDQRAVFSGKRNIYAPAEYSYHCARVTNELLEPAEKDGPTSQWSVSFGDFQIQGFNVPGGNFSYASDCAGFFTPGIWMGLLTSLLMVLILTYGLHMITQLRTMDRFDDPKGPTISVPQNE